MEKSETEEVFDRNAESLGDAGAPFDGWGMDAAFDEADEFDGILRLFCQLFLREAFVLPQFRNSLT